MNGRVRSVLAFVFLAAAGSIAYYFWLARQVRFASFDNGRFHVSDFAYHALAIRELLFGASHSNPYRVDSLVLLFQHLVDERVREVMPIVVTPVALIGFLPFSLMTYISVEAAQSVWAGCSTSALILALLSFGRSVRRRPRREQLLCIGAVVVFIGSQSFFYTLALGQTSILFVAATLALSSRLAPQERVNPLDVVLLIAAATKPTYLGLIFILLVNSRRWDLLSVLGILVFVPSALLTVILGPVWIPDYFTMFSYYAAEQIPLDIRSSLVFEKMNVFRSAWIGIADRRQLLGLSKIVFCAISVLSMVELVRQLRVPRFAATREELFPFAAVLGGYLLFSPYLSFYEDLLLLLLIMPFSRRSLDAPGFPPVVLLLLLFPSLNFYDWLSTRNRSWFWIGKALFVAGALWLVRPRVAGEIGEDKGYAERKEDRCGAPGV